MQERGPNSEGSGGPAAEGGPVEASEARRLVAELGVRLPDQVFLSSREDLWIAAEAACARLPGDRVVVKASAPGLVHKTEVGGVCTVERDPEAVAAALRGMAERLSAWQLDGFVVEEYVDHDTAPGGELLLSVRWTDDFGPVVTLGLGGVSTELLSGMLREDARTLMVAPELTSPESVDALLRRGELAALITGAFRGQTPRVRPEELARVLRAAMDLGASRIPGELVELELNPLAWTPAGPVALDVVARRGAVGSMAAPRPIAKIEALLHPGSVAVMGVSRKLNPGHAIVNNLLDHGFPRERIWIVKPGADEIEGCRCVEGIAELPEPVDLLVLSVAAEHVPEAVEEAVAHRAAESLIVIPGGLGERRGSEDLEARVRRTLDRARDTDWGGPVVNGGNCLGVRSIPGRYDTMFLPPYKVAPARRPDTPVAVISQSGAFLVSKASKQLELSPRYMVSVGNQIDLTVGDYFRFLAADEELRAFAFYVEGFQPGDGRRWLEVATEVVDSGRPVVLYRAGRTPAGARASASHTAAIAGDAAITRHLAAAAGVLVADTIADFEDLLMLACRLHDRRVPGRRLGALSNAGFETVAFADNLGGLELAKLGESTRERLSELLRARRLERIVAPVNPLDVNPMMEDEGFVATARLLLADDAVDVGIVGCVPLTGALQTLAPGPEHPEDIDDPDSVVSRLCGLWDRTDKAWVAVVDGGPLYDPMARRLRRHGVPTFRSADRALRLLGRYCEWALAHRQRQERERPEEAVGPVLATTG